MKDKYQKDLCVGDDIAFNHSSYRGVGDIGIGAVIGFTAKMVKVAWPDGSGGNDVANRDPHNVVKIDGANSEALEKEILLLKYKITVLQDQLAYAGMK